LTISEDQIESLKCLCSKHNVTSFTLRCFKTNEYVQITYNKICVKYANFEGVFYRYGKGKGKDEGKVIPVLN